MGAADQFEQERKTWLAAGRPMRSRERVPALFAAHCESCPLRAGKLCTAIGGTVDPKNRYMNFLAWATSKCPKGNFGPEPEAARESLPPVSTLPTAIVRTPRGPRRIRIRWAKPPCRWLGPATGKTHKGSCASGAMLAEHVCYCEARRASPRRRDGIIGEPVYQPCTPTGTCQLKQIVQPCGQCPLYQPQRLLAVR